MLMPGGAGAGTVAAMTAMTARRTFRSRGPAFWAAVVAGVLVAAAGALVAAFFALAFLFNPVADEWQCSEGEAPADHRAGGSACFREGASLPRGYTWDKWGNRPLSSNCDKDGWTPVERGDLTDCVREGTKLPAGWHERRLG